MPVRCCVSQGADRVSELPDTVDFLEQLRGLHAAETSQDQGEAESTGPFFQEDVDIFVGRAPGRLDVMGGIADYSGSLVLQLPLAVACHAAVQMSPTSGPGRLRMVSLSMTKSGRRRTYTRPLADLRSDSTGLPVPYSQLRRRAAFSSIDTDRWLAYVAGAVLVLMHECGARVSGNLSILIHSAIPEGKGVSSSAAVEVATMSAVAAAMKIKLPGRQLAQLCQKVENECVGAPCGIMDQMAVTLGAESELMALLCQPAELQSPVAIPANVRFWGLDSGERHSVGGADYGTVRAAAFMGLRMLSAAAQGVVSCNGESHAGFAMQNGSNPQDLVGRGYLANVDPSRYYRDFDHALPDSMTGQDFLAEYGTHVDAATTVEPAVRYPIRAATRHPVQEHWRVTLFRQLLQTRELSDSAAACLGELMYQSHVSYGSCGLGSAGTDLLVDLVQAEAAAARDAGQVPPLHGAKITGGGSGGTVCVMGSSGDAAEAAIERIRQAYRKAKAYLPQIFCDSSMGAERFGVVKLRLVDS